MNTQEIGQLLGLMAFHDNRKIGPGDIMAWEEVLPTEISLIDARAALRELRQAGPDWIMPSHIIEKVMTVRKDRLIRAGTPPIPGGLEYTDEKSWRQLWCSAVKDGETRDEAEATTNHAMKITPSDLAVNAARVRAIEALAQSKSITKENQ